MDRQLVFDVTDAPPSRYSLVRGIGSLAGIVGYGLFGLAVSLIVALPAGLGAEVARKDGNDAFWLYVLSYGAMALGPIAGLFLLYRRDAAQGRRALKRIRVFGISLREVRAKLAKHRAGGGRLRGLMLLLNLALAVATPFAAVFIFDALDNTVNGPLPPTWSLWTLLLTGAFVLNGLRLWSDRGSFFRTFVRVAAIIAAWVGWILLASRLGAASEAPDGVTGFALLAGYIASFMVLTFITGSLWARARGTMADMLKRDKRPLILYLRSFDDEDSEGGSPAERALKNALRAYGPFVAIGRPGNLQPDAAARMQVKDSEWRDVVLDLMNRAGAIIVAPGMTAGLDWEIRQITERGLIGKAVFVFPPKTDTQQRFDRMIDMLGDGPEAQSLTRLQASSIIAVSYTGDAGWLAVTAQYATDGIYQAVVDTALYGLWASQTAGPVTNR